MQYFIDTHHHLWDLHGQIGYDWLTQPNLDEKEFLGDYRAICQDFLLDNYNALIPKGYHCLGTVHCEAECNRSDNLKEAQWIAKLNRKNLGRVQAQSVWVDILADNAKQTLTQLCDINGVRGVRFKPNSDFADAIKTDAKQIRVWQNGLSLLADFDLLWELRVPAHQLLACYQLLKPLPDLTVVINHCGLPWDRTPSGLSVWQEGLSALASLPNVWMKLSELGVPNTPYDVAQNAQILQTILAIFGPKRCLFASNAPVASLRVSFGDWLGLVEGALAPFDKSDGDDVFYKNAIKVYRTDIHQSLS